MGDHAKARDLLIESYAAYLRSDNKTGAAKSLNRLAQIQFQMGQVDRALENIALAIDIYDSIGMHSKATHIQINRAAVLFMCGGFQEARAVYRQVDLCISDYSGCVRAQFNLTYGMALALAGESDQSMKRLAEARRQAGDAHLREVAQYQEYLGWVLLLKGKPDDALDALEEGLQRSLEIAPESALVAQIKQLMADAHVLLRNWETAEKSADEALVVAEHINERVVIAACWRVFAQVERHRGHLDKARDWFEKAIDLFNLIGSKYELAMTRYLAATMGLYVNGERTALLYLARQYFRSEDLKHCIAKVDAALKSEPPAPTKTSHARRDQSPPTMIGQCEKLRDVLNLAERIAGSERPVLLTGATGTGKDLLARFIHYHSGRSGEFVPVNTAAIPTDMVEAELFGHTKGAFTGAQTERVGLFEQAAGGTLYLDEIADAPLEFQAKLLQVLESRQVRKLGQNKLRPISCRVIAATNHDLQARIRENKFRLDLYHRLNYMSLELPPLTERREDMPLLIEHFLAQEGLSVKSNGNAGIIDRLGLVLSMRSWPGNVRELQAEIQRLVMSAQGDLVRMIELALGYDGCDERAQLVTALEATGGNKTRAAEILGVSEGTIRKRISKYGVPVH